MTATRLSLSALTAAFGAWPAHLPEVSGAKTKSFEFKVRVVFPWDRHAETLLAARTGSFEQLSFLRSLGKTLALTYSDTPMTVVDLLVSERKSRFFKSKDGEPAMTALLSVTLSYSAHRAYTGAEMRKSLGVTVNNERYPDDCLKVTVLPNS